MSARFQNYCDSCNLNVKNDRKVCEWCKERCICENCVGDILVNDKVICNNCFDDYVQHRPNCKNDYHQTFCDCLETW